MNKGRVKLTGLGSDSFAQSFIERIIPKALRKQRRGGDIRLWCQSNQRAHGFDKVIIGVTVRSASDDIDGEQAFVQNNLDSIHRYPPDFPSPMVRLKPNCCKKLTETKAEVHLTGGGSRKSTLAPSFASYGSTRKKVSGTFSFRLGLFRDWR
ncbi:hypothetical protein ACPPVV_09945 [Rhodanobacter sp. Col0626]|uniref:hypothetical protein n=1 Tax=Rhodanobacter sp. Col0626 TaxID=3415679 RepID=UPI003CF043CC